MKSPYISRVKIKNFRNFKDVDVDLSHKQVIIGENNVGKTNFLRAIQLILDPTFTDEDRYLEETDFFEGIRDPLKNEEVIEVSIEISGYTHNKNILAQLSDATIISDGIEKLRIIYKYFPIEDDDGNIEYKYIIFKSDNENIPFTHEDRKYLNIKVIKAMRDVDNEIQNTRKSPINKLLKYYEIEKDELEEIATNLAEQSADILSLDEIADLEDKINQKFWDIFTNKPGSQLALKTLDIDPNKLLYSLKLMMGDRQISETSLGLNNILYISLILLQFQDRTIPTFLKESKYNLLKEKVNGTILENTYIQKVNNNYFLKKNISKSDENKLYDFMEKHISQNQGATILAIEEPESHLHPIFQRLIYKNIIKNNEVSVLTTTHSTHVTSIAPLKSIVHLCKKINNETKVFSTINIDLTEKEIRDIQRYIDAKRGEIYFGKGIIFVEGVAEEYLIPAFANLIGKPLDERGIIVCNINSTNFKPYVKFMEKLNVPYVVITDGDFYVTHTNDDGKTKKKYHVMYKGDNQFSYAGIELVGEILLDLCKLTKKDIEEVDFADQDDIFKKHGFFIGEYTLEVDIMNEVEENESKKIICDTFNELTSGGETQKNNFKKELNGEQYWKCLSKIESNGIGKGRFAQRLSIYCTADFLPDYVKNAIEHIYKKVDVINALF